MEIMTFITLIVPIITAVLGYFLREWQNYFVPFTKIVSFEGDYINGTVDVNDSICNKLESSINIPDLKRKKIKGRYPVSDVNDARDGAKRTKDIVPEILSSIDKVITAIKKNTNDDNLFTLLKAVFSTTYLDSFILGLYATGNLNDISVQSNSYHDIICTESSMFEGCFLLTFRNKSYLYIGSSFNKNELNRKIFVPIKEMVTNMDRNAIRDFFLYIKDYLRKELDIATNVLSELENLLDSHSKWESVIYIVNMRDNPILLDYKAILHVKDKKTGAEFNESCILALPYKDEEGAESIKNRKVPLLIPKGGNYTCYFFTEKNQSEMESGETFRSVFAKGEAEAWIDLNIESIGFVKRRKVTTPKLLFKDYTT